MTISERMFSLLDERGLSASGLCKVLGVGTNQTTNWKQRNTDPPAKYIVLICEYLGCSLEYLLTGQEAEKAPVPGSESRVVSGHRPGLDRQAVTAVRTATSGPPIRNPNIPDN